MSIRTVIQSIESESGFLQPALDIVATIPVDAQSNRIPISLVVGFKQEYPLKSASSLACYYYAIPLTKDRYMNSKSGGSGVVGIPLLDTNNDKIRDIARRLATIISEKFKRPCYITWSSLPNEDSSMLIANHLYILNKCLNFLKVELSRQK
ncbi:Poc4p [Saccharomyces cerevisiae x Saccharomyces kudriavzevii VIN7]|uniref:Poc4p n=1 Tax=Saccharomyces cerevisiae x Saccharomyces kudriavzevii (strain VIN7) TaxID=1095631 RepID=H0H1Z1_SACCK|nr:Poc4p [Saccharomyces cerevisiae x Saccharomyces kudriavzevii VIN7]